MAQVVPNGPSPNAMLDGPAKQIMDGSSGMMVRQDLKICCPQIRNNTYKVAQAGPEHFTEEAKDEWSEEEFKNAPAIFKMEEDSSILCKICLYNKRETTVNINDNSGGRLFSMYKPMKLAIPCTCFMICPEEITTQNNRGETIGTTKHDYSCMDDMCMKQWNKIDNANGETVYWVENNFCCNANMFAPTMCCKARTFDIYDASKTTVIGSYSNLFSCNPKRLCFPGMDQYKIKFPADATAEGKALILSSMMLHDFMLFERAEQDSG